MLSVVEFQLDELGKSMILEAKSDFSYACTGLDVHVVQYDELGRRLCEDKDINPDAVMQLAFQVS